MRFMVVEHFAPGQLHEVYRIVRKHDRMLPDGLTYIDSWITASLGLCFQIMEADDPLLLQEWAARWGDLADIEIYPIVPSRETSALFARLAAEESPAE